MREWIFFSKNGIEYFQMLFLVSQKLLILELYHAMYFVTYFVGSLQNIWEAHIAGRKASDVI